MISILNLDNMEIKPIYGYLVHCNCKMLAPMRLIRCDKPDEHGRVFNVYKCDKCGQEIMIMDFRKKPS